MMNKSKFGPKYHKYHQPRDFLGLADDRLLVVTGYVVKLDTVAVEIVENSDTKLIAFSIVRLGTWWASSSSMGPFHVVVGLTRRPSDCPSGDSPSGPEILFSISGDQVLELPLLSTAFNADGLHAVLLAEARGTSVSEGPAAQPPAHKVVFTSELVVRLVASATASTPKTTGALGLGPTEEGGSPRATKT